MAAGLLYRIVSVAPSTAPQNSFPHFFHPEILKKKKNTKWMNQFRGLQENELSVTWLWSQTQHRVFCPLKFALHLIFGRHFPLFSLTFQLLLLMSNTGSSFEAFPNENARRVLVFQRLCQLQRSLILCANFKVDCFGVLDFKGNCSEKPKTLF